MLSSPVATVGCPTVRYVSVCVLHRNNGYTYCGQTQVPSFSCRLSPIFDLPVCSQMMPCMPSTIIEESPLGVVRLRLTCSEILKRRDVGFGRETCTLANPHLAQRSNGYPLWQYRSALCWERLLTVGSYMENRTI